MSISNINKSNNTKLKKAVKRATETKNTEMYSETTHNQSYCVIVD